MHPRVMFHLNAIGVSKREARAANATPIRQTVLDGKGFGLIGTTGVGKTWGLVRALADDLERIVTESHDPENANRPLKYAAWVNWPEQAEALKGMVSQGFHAEVEDLVQRWEQVGMLFLDDLGAERVTGDNDFSLGLLRRVIDSRYRNEKQIYWTSNLEPKTLRSIYGVRISSRMMQAWPVKVVRGTDLRLAEASA